MTKASRSSKVKVAVLASGRGSNAQAIYHYSQGLDTSFEIDCILSNKEDAGVLSFAKSKGIDIKVFDRETFYKSEAIAEYLSDREVRLIVLAGFLWLIPSYLVKAYPRRILNIHPALLPKYGGKGFYGHHVHEAVKRNGDEKSGITIHYVNDKYDEGHMIFQSQCLLEADWTPEQIGKSVLRLEHHFYPQVINGVASKL